MENKRLEFNIKQTDLGDCGATLCQKYGETDGDFFERCISELSYMILENGVKKGDLPRYTLEGMAVHGHKCNIADIVPPFPPFYNYNLSEKENREARENHYKQWEKRNPIIESKEFLVEGVEKYLKYIGFTEIPEGFNMKSLMNFMEGYHQHKLKTWSPFEHEDTENPTIEEIRDAVPNYSKTMESSRFLFKDIGNPSDDSNYTNPLDSWREVGMGDPEDSQLSEDFIKEIRGAIKKSPKTAGEIISNIHLETLIAGQEGVSTEQGMTGESGGIGDVGLNEGEILQALINDLQDLHSVESGDLGPKDLNINPLNARLKECVLDFLKERIQSHIKALGLQK